MFVSEASQHRSGKDFHIIKLVCIGSGSDFAGSAELYGKHCSVTEQTGNVRITGIDEKSYCFYNGKGDFLWKVQ